MKQKISIFIILFLLLMPVFASAEIAPKLELNYPSLPPFAINPPTTSVGQNVLTYYIVYIFGFVIVISAIAAVVMIAIGGVEYSSSVGSPEKMKSGANKITSSVLGLIILGCSVLILKTINPNLINIKDPTVAPVSSYFNSGVYACKERIPFEDIWNGRKSLTEMIKNDSKNPDQKLKANINAMSKTLNQYINMIADNCYYCKSVGKVPDGFIVSYIYLVPEEGKRAFGAIIYDDITQKSRARVIYGDGESDKVPLDKPCEWPIEDVAKIRPFELINNSPTGLFASLYQMPFKNRGADEAKKTQCSTHGQIEEWCDISSLALTAEPATPEATPEPTPPPAEDPSSDTTEDTSTEDNNGSSSSSSKPPKISSVEFAGDQFLVFFKDDVSDWYSDEEIDVIGPSSQNNLAGGEFIMGEWNEECKERRAEQPNSESFYPCAKKAILINAKFY